MTNKTADVLTTAKI